MIFNGVSIILKIIILSRVIYSLIYESQRIHSFIHSTFIHSFNWVRDVVMSTNYLKVFLGGPDINRRYDNFDGYHT